MSEEPLYEVASLDSEAVSTHATSETGIALDRVRSRAQAYLAHKKNITP